VASPEAWTSPGNSRHQRGHCPRALLERATGSVDDLARTLEAYRDLGIATVQAILEPMTVRSVERLAEAARLVGI
jgi:hypothetical protein